MNHFAFRPYAGRTACLLAVTLALAILPAARASHDRSPETTTPVATAAAAATVATVLAPEFRVIRPAGVGDDVPSIPPSELWPAQ